jgi:tetratricopeptide (TPR) repeat protein
VHASTEDRFELGYRTIAEQLNLPGHNFPKSNIYHLVRIWLENDKERKWLFIIDGLDNDDFFARCLPGTALPLFAFLPRSDCGSIIVTTRRRSVAGRFVGEKSVLEVDAMDGGSAVALLRKKKMMMMMLESEGEGEDGDEDEMGRLVEALDCVPLAIVQAGSYLSQRGCGYTVQKYLDEYSKSDDERRKLRDYEAGRIHRQEFEARNSCVVACEIAFDCIRAVRPSAADLLGLMSFFDRQGIQGYLLRDYSQSDRGSGANLSADPSDEQKSGSSDSDGEKRFQDDIAMLRTYSLVCMHADERTFEMYRSVQLAVHQWLKSHHIYEKWKEKFIIHLNTHFPSDFANMTPRREDCQSMYPHVKLALYQVPQSEESRLQRAELLYRAAYYAGQSDNPNDMEAMASESGRERALLVGENHIDTLRSDLMLVKAFEFAGQWDKAMILGDAQVKACMNALGEEDDVTIMSMVNLGHIFYEMGCFEDAQAMHSRALETCKSLRIEDGPRGIGAKCGLALSLGKQGQFEEAESLQVQVVSSLKRVLGEESNETIANMHNLAMIYGWKGKFEDAESVYLQAFDISKKMLGGKHSSTPFIMGLLAAIYTKMNRHSETESLLQECLEFQQKKLGDSHPDTLSSKLQLAKFYHRQERYSDAQRLHADILDVHEITLGEEHPDTLTSMSNLALTYSGQRRYADAELLLSEVFELRKKMLGDEHPDTLASMNSLSIALVDLGEYPAAARLQARALKIRIRVLGVEHPATLESMHNLALAYLDQDRYQDAEKLFGRLLDIQKGVLGENHPDTIDSMDNLAFAWMRLDKKKDAVELMEKCVDLKTQVLGSDHPETVKSRDCLLSWRSEDLSVDD